jgi:hypothetical protein
LDPEGREVLKCGFKIGGGIDQDYRKSPQGYTDNVCLKISRLTNFWFLGGGRKKNSPTQPFVQASHTLSTQGQATGTQKHTHHILIGQTHNRSINTRS